MFSGGYLHWNQSIMINKHFGTLCISLSTELMASSTFWGGGGVINGQNQPYTVALLTFFDISFLSYV